jgi:hypothetical protein
MNKLIFFIIGLVLIILGFFTFSYIGVLNEYEAQDTNSHLLIVFLGFILEIIGIIFMILIIRKNRGSKVDNS